MVQNIYLTFCEDSIILTGYKVDGLYVFSIKQTLSNRYGLTTHFGVSFEEKMKELFGVDFDWIMKKFPFENVIQYHQLTNEYSFDSQNNLRQFWILVFHGLLTTNDQDDVRIVVKLSRKNSDIYNKLRLEENSKIFYSSCEISGETFLLMLENKNKIINNENDITEDLTALNIYVTKQKLSFNFS